MFVSFRKPNTNRRYEMDKATANKIKREIYKTSINADRASKLGHHTASRAHWDKVAVLRDSLSK